MKILQRFHISVLFHLAESYSMPSKTLNIYPAISSLPDLNTEAV